MPITFSFFMPITSELGDELERHCVNYLRHRCTDYHSHLDGISGRVGTDDAYLEIKTAILDAIAEKYDWLADECRRQVNETLMQRMRRDCQPI